ncbi:MAG: DNA polymerase III subunit gamma/tau, partial [Bryobacteraceae bacterium]
GSRMLEIVSDLERHGQSLQHFCRELSRYWRNLLVAKIAGQTTTLIAASETEQAQLRETAKAFSEEDLTRFLSLTLGVYKDLQTSLQPRLHLELGLVKLVHAGKLRSIEEAIADLGAPEPAAPASARTVLPAPNRERTQASAAAPSVAIRTAPKPLNIAPSPKPEVPESPVAAPPAVSPSIGPTPLPDPGPVSDASLKQNFYDALCAAGLQFSADALMQCDIELKGGDLVLKGPKGSLFSLRDPKVQTVAAQVAGRPVKVRLEAGEAAATSGVVTKPSNGNDNESALRERALEHPGVKRFQELFPDAQVRTVRNLNE